jgi:hypothetical protein
MTDRLIIFIACLTLFLLVIPANAVIVTGKGLTEQEAVQDGLRTAVEMAAGVFVYAVTDVSSYIAQKDKVTSASGGFVHTYKILKMVKQDDIYLVTIDVVVDEKGI